MSETIVRKALDCDYCSENTGTGGCNWKHAEDCECPCGCLMVEAVRDLDMYIVTDHEADEISPEFPLSGRYVNVQQGEVAYFSSGLRFLTTEDMPCLMAIPNAVMDRMQEDLIGQSNFERIKEDWGKHVIEVTYTYHDFLAVKVGEYIPEPLWDAINGLRDYPLYDEDDHSKREWEAYESEVHDALGDAERDALNDLDEDEPDNWDVLDTHARHVVHKHIEDAGQWSRAEDVDREEVSKVYGQAIKDAIQKEWEDLAREVTHQMFKGTAPLF